MDSTLPIENTASQEFGHTFSFNVFIIFYLFINSTIFIIIFMTIYIFDNDWRYQTYEARYMVFSRKKPKKCEILKTYFIFWILLNTFAWIGQKPLCHRWECKMRIICLPDGIPSISAYFNMLLITRTMIMLTTEEQLLKYDTKKRQHQNWKNLPSLKKWTKADPPSAPSNVTMQPIHNKKLLSLQII